MFLDGRFSEAYEDNDAIAAEVALVWGDVNVVVGFPVVNGPDVANLLNDPVSLANEGLRLGGHRGRRGGHRCGVGLGFRLNEGCSLSGGRWGLQS